MWRVPRFAVLSGVFGLASTLSAACGDDVNLQPRPGLTSGGSGGSAGTGSAGSPIFLGGFGGTVSPPSSGPCGAASPAAPLTRWSIPDLDGTLDALFATGTTLASVITIDDQGYQRDLSSAFISALRDVATERVRHAVADDATFDICDDAQDQPSCLEPWLRQWGEQLYRRPLTAQQVLAYVAQFRGALLRSTPAEAARNVLVSMILSPYFVFRVELGEAADGQLLTTYEVATRLSHFASRQSPDAELLARAADGSLRDPAQLVAQLHRLWNKPEGHHARSLQHLELLGLSAKTLPTTLDAELRADMVAQGSAFVDDVFESHDGSFDSLLTARRQPLTVRLAQHYGVPAPAGDGIQFVDADPSLAAGLLSEGLFLATYPRPTLRGRAIVEKLQCQRLPEHPVTVDQTLGTQGSPRQRILQRTAENPTCATCHQLMDPIGFALDAFDDQGRATGFSTATTLPPTLQGLTVAVPRDLGTAIASNNTARSCIAQRYLEAAVDRPISDNPYTAKIVVPPGSGAPPPANNLDPDHQWIECVARNATAADFNLTKAAELVVAGSWLQERAGAPRHFAALDTSLDPVAHAYQEAAQFLGAFPDSADDQTVQRYMDGLHSVEVLDQQGHDTPNAGGASGAGAGGAP